MQFTLDLDEILGLSEPIDPWVFGEIDSQPREKRS